MEAKTSQNWRGTWFWFSKPRFWGSMLVFQGSCRISRNFSVGSLEKRSITKNTVPKTMKLAIENNFGIWNFGEIYFFLGTLKRSTHAFSFLAQVGVPIPSSALRFLANSYLVDQRLENKSPDPGPKQEGKSLTHKFRLGSDIMLVHRRVWT